MATKMLSRTSKLAGLSCRHASRPDTCSLRHPKPFTHHRRMTVFAVAEADKVVDEVDKDVGSAEAEDEIEFLPTKQQVQSLLTVLCEETEIAEMNLKMGTFELKVRRSVTPDAPVYAPAPAYAAAAPAPAAAAAREAPAAASVEDTVEDTVDEGLLYVEAAKVGIFRRGRYAAGKRVGKGNCVEQGDTVKRGQTLAFIEQLGTYFELKAPQAGEIVKILVEDGSAVEYKQVVVEMIPFFGGHIIGDKKWDL